MINNGCQVVLANNYCRRAEFYHFIETELNIRQHSRDMPKVYFMALFACCRTNYTKGKAKAMGETKIQKQRSKGFHKLASNIYGQPNQRSTSVSRRMYSSMMLMKKKQVEEHSQANFTILFGCDPKTGVASETKFVHEFISHI